MIQSRTKKQNIFTQKEIANRLKVSLSTVFNALKPLRGAHIAEVSGRNFRLLSYEKLLYMWASFRKLDKDIIYRAATGVGAKNLEGLMPPSVVFGLYSAFSHKFIEEPADYDHVYVYADENKLGDILRRLPEEKPKLSPNFFILKKDNFLGEYQEMPPEQIFIDIWNAPEWYAKDFLKALEEKLRIKF